MAIKKNILKIFVIFCVVIVLIYLCFIGYNNFSLCNKKSLANNIDISLQRAIDWVNTNKETILKENNIALIKMLNECQKIKPNPVFGEITNRFMKKPVRPECWKRLIDPNYSVNTVELNKTIKSEILDNQWCLYAVDAKQAEFDPKAAGLFEPDKWQHRKLTHQLDALIALQKYHDKNAEIEKLINHLCDRLCKRNFFSISVLDIYIQRVTFVLRAGYPEKIRQRWVERIINNQLDDGGWNDKWFIFISDSRRPNLSFDEPPSNQHATVQALTALYYIKYKYPQCCNLQSK
jgi:hypothetical protein